MILLSGPETPPFGSALSLRTSLQVEFHLARIFILVLNIPTGTHSRRDLSSTSSAVIFLVVVLNLCFRLSVSGCRFVLKSMKLILRIAYLECVDSNHLSSSDAFTNSLPTEISTARQYFDLDPEVTTYACCPTCFALYPPQPVDQHMNDESPPQPDPPSIRPFVPYPELCTFKETQENSPCGSRLIRFGAKAPRPIRVYTHQHLASWLGRMLCRPNVEALLDASQYNASIEKCSSTPVDDILGSEEVLHFQGPDGFPFFRVHGSEGRYLFALFVDWFNPRGNKHGGRVYSSGVIIMVLLNLPPTLRYKRENVYLAGVMPGPKAPSLQQVNHFLEILVLELREFWFLGVKMPRTALRPRGRMVRCAVLPLVCDLAAGRKVSGHASHSSSFFCSFCQLRKSSINELNQALWPRRSCGEHRLVAEEWRNATTQRSRDQIFHSHGVRYSVMLMLPYWQPTRHVVVDTMHNLFLGLLQRHCRHTFGMNAQVQSRETPEDIVRREPVSAEELLQAQAVVSRCRNARSLKRLSLRLLQAVYMGFGLGSPGTLLKIQLAERILQVCDSDLSVLGNDKSHPIFEASPQPRSSLTRRHSARHGHSNCSRCSKAWCASREGSSSASPLRHVPYHLSELCWATTSGSWKCVRWFPEC